MIAIIDYGASNLRSVVNAFEALETKTIVTNNPADLKRADAIVLPGVGAFGDGIKSLRKLNLVEAINEEVLLKKKPYLGLCLGLQFTATESREQGRHKGFGWIKGTVRKIHPDNKKFRVPHIGWNNLDLQKNSPLFEGIENLSFYFLHSFQLEVDKADLSAVSATCWHGEKITASI